MLFGHVPRASLTTGGFAIVTVALAYATVPGGLNAPTLAWLATALAIALARTMYALTYLRSTQRRSPSWQRGFLGWTLSVSLCWGALPWVLPMNSHSELSAAIIGSTIGMAAAGTSMLSVDRINTRAWLLPMLLSASIFCASSGGPLGWFGFISVNGFLVILWLEAERTHRRITEMLRLRFESEELAKAREQALRQAEQLSDAKGRFLATMSHEMRTPLHGILGLSRMLRGELASPTAHAQMDLLQNAGEHLVCVINDVLDYSRLSEGRLTLKPRPVDLNELARGVCALADVTAKEKAIGVSMQSDLPDDMFVQVDPDRLKQILINLIGNAVKFTEQGHVVLRLLPTRSSQPEQLMVAFEVEDTGCGIPNGELDRIFDTFHQVDARDERATGGTGLGLSIAQQICKAMHGEIRCDSRMGMGSTFRFVLPLPLLPEPLIAGTPARAHAQSGALADTDAPLQGTVLLVEDNPVNALVAQAALEQIGLTVCMADNGRKALDWLSEHTADLILMDCHMPVMGGIEATRRIREIEAQHGLPTIPIVAMSASSQADDHNQCLAVGMNDYISKPFAHEDMVRVLRQHLHRPPNCRESPSVHAQAA